MLGRLQDFESHLLVEESRDSLVFREFISRVLFIDWFENVGDFWLVEISEVVIFSLKTNRQ
jgi:hypothetical protein